MHPSLSTSYLLPAILLNPVLFLHSLNTILSRVLPPTVVASPIQPPPYSKLGPSANHPHLDIHASETLCWCYTVLIMIVQMIVFGRINNLREKRRESKRTKETRLIPIRQSMSKQGKQMNGHAHYPNGVSASPNGREVHEIDNIQPQPQDKDCPSSETDSESAGTDRTTDSEIIL